MKKHLKKHPLLTLLVALIFVLAACGGSVARFEVQFACLNRALPPCLAAEEFAERVSRKTGGQVRIRITGLTEGGLIHPKSEPWLEEGAAAFLEVHNDYFGPLTNMDNIWGLYSDYETQLKVIDAIRDDVERSIEDKSGRVALAYLFYPSNYFFSNKPLRTASDMEGLRVRTFKSSGYRPFDIQSHFNVSRDMLDGMNAIAHNVVFSEVHKGFERGILDAAVSCSACGSNLGWYELTDYLVGPIVALGHSSIIVNQEEWAGLPQSIQAVIREELKLLEETTLMNALTVWDQQGVQGNVEGGMEYIELTEEMKDLARHAALAKVLPNWVERAGGPKSEAVAIFNAKAAPIVKVEITDDGQARELE